MYDAHRALTSSSAPRRPTSAVSTMPSSGSAASAKAAGKARRHISLSCLECSQLECLLALLSSSPGSAAADGGDEAFPLATSGDAAAVTTAARLEPAMQSGPATPDAAAYKRRKKGVLKLLLVLSKLLGVHWSRC